jgi:hypothetical protein
LNALPPNYVFPHAFLHLKANSVSALINTLFALGQVTVEHIGTCFHRFEFTVPLPYRIVCGDATQEQSVLCHFAFFQNVFTQVIQT